MVRALTNLKKKNPGNVEEQHPVATQAPKKRARDTPKDNFSDMSESSIDSFDHEVSDVELETPRRSSRKKLPCSRYCGAEFVLSSSQSQDEGHIEANEETPTDAVVPAFGRTKGDKEDAPSDASA